MKVLETQRLILRRFSLEDAAFILALVNDPAWLEHIGDRNVRTLEDAGAYLRKGALDMYERLGFGMYVVALKGSGETIGTCGLIKRDALDDVDIGFAFLPQFRGQGYALESAAAVLQYGESALGLKRIVAIVSPANHRSIRILETIGLRFDRMVKLPGEDGEIPLYAYQSDGASGPRPIRLKPADAERYARLHARMLTVAPWAFGASPDDDQALDLACLAKVLAQEHNATFAIEAPKHQSLDPTGVEKAEGQPELVAAASVTRTKQPKFAHRAKIWGVFVEPAHRGKGLGRAIMAAVIDRARSWPGVDFVDLGVSENSTEALRLYERLGFKTWGREPEATEHEGRRYDEIYMSLRL